MSDQRNSLSVVKDEASKERSYKWKRHEFSDFLTKTGVTAALAKGVLELHRAKERPTDPIEFIRIRMRPNNEDQIKIEEYRQKIEELTVEADTVRAERDRLFELKQRIKVALSNECDDGEEY